MSGRRQTENDSTRQYTAFTFHAHFPKVINALAADKGSDSDRDKREATADRIRRQAAGSWQLPLVGCGPFPGGRAGQNACDLMGRHRADCLLLRHTLTFGPLLAKNALSADPATCSYLEAMTRLDTAAIIIFLCLFPPGRKF